MDTAPEVGAVGEGGGASAAPVETTSAAASTPAATPAVGTPMVPETPAYNPNYKFKVMDQEKEFDEYLRPVIKDIDTEKKIRELYEKAYGLDHVKPKYESLKTQFEDVNGKYTTVAQDLQKLGIHLKNNDLQSFFGAFQLSDEQILKYAIDRLNYYDLPPEKQQELDAQGARNAQLAQLQQENQQFKQWKEQQETQQMRNELDQTLNAQHVAPIVMSFDQRAGKPGAFMEAVVNYARAEFARLGKDLTPAEAVQGFVTTFGLNAQAASPQPAVEQAVDGNPQSAQRAATLPKIPASGASPVKQKVKSLADLHKLRDQAMGNI